MVRGVKRNLGGLKNEKVGSKRSTKAPPPFPVSEFRWLPATRFSFISFKTQVRAGTSVFFAHSSSRFSPDCCRLSVLQAERWARHMETHMTFAAPLTCNYSFWLLLGAPPSFPGYLLSAFLAPRTHSRTQPPLKKTPRRSPLILCLVRISRGSNPPGDNCGVVGTAAYMSCVK